MRRFDDLNSGTGVDWGTNGVAFGRPLFLAWLTKRVGIPLHRCRAHSEIHLAVFEGMALYWLVSPVIFYASTGCYRQRLQTNIILNLMPKKLHDFIWGISTILCTKIRCFPIHLYLALQCLFHSFAPPEHRNCLKFLDWSLLIRLWKSLVQYMSWLLYTWKKTWHWESHLNASVQSLVSITGFSLYCFIFGLITVWASILKVGLLCFDHSSTRSLPFSFRNLMHGWRFFKIDERFHILVRSFNGITLTMITDWVTFVPAIFSQAPILIKIFVKTRYIYN